MIDLLITELQNYKEGVPDTDEQNDISSVRIDREDLSIKVGP